MRSKIFVFGQLVGIAIICAGCVSPHGGPVAFEWVDSAWHKCFPRRRLVEGTDGSSYETALRVHRVDKSSLPETERGWVYQKHWMSLTPQPSLQQFKSSTQHSTERRGEKVYDVVILTLPSGESRTTYFDVTGYRYFWPKE
jgi:hypothetical protein